MEQAVSKPTGSVIEEFCLPEGITLQWPLPSPGPQRYMSAAFLICWLGGWAFGEVMVIIALIGGLPGGAGPQLFLLFWLGWLDHRRLFRDLVSLENDSAVASWNQSGSRLSSCTTSPVPVHRIRFSKRTGLRGSQVSRRKTPCRSPCALPGTTCAASSSIGLANGSGCGSISVPSASRLECVCASQNESGCMGCSNGGGVREESPGLDLPGGKS